MRQRDANLTALAAIGPRKKRKVDSPGPGSGTEVQGARAPRAARDLGHLAADLLRGPGQHWLPAFARDSLNQVYLFVSVT